MITVDAHLDLAYLALRGRELNKPAKEQTPGPDEGTPSVGLPDLRAGDVRLICATLFCEPARAGRTGYTDSNGAREQAMNQLRWYEQEAASGELAITTAPEQLKAVHSPGEVNAIILMEGSDPFRSPEDVAEWFEAGLRCVGLAWKSTRYAGGTGEPGPITAEGREIVKALDAVKIIHDASHLAEESFWQLLEISDGPVMASHSNCRSIVPTDRQLSDEMIVAIAKRGGVIGINFFDKFLLPPGETRRANLQDVVRHLRHMCDLIGDVDHVGIGTDMDGGFSQEHIPEEIKTCADMPLLAGALLNSGFSPQEVSKVMGENWLRFFEKNLACA